MTHWNRLDIKNVMDQKPNKSAEKMLHFEEKTDTLISVSVHNAVSVTID